MKKAGTPEEVTSPSQGNLSTAIEAQELRTLDALIAGSANTIELRHLHNVMHPSGRVKSLRDKGHTILTCRESALDAEGRLHPRVARYVLIRLASDLPSDSGRGGANGSQSR